MACFVLYAKGGGHYKHFHACHYDSALSAGKFRIEDENGVREVELKTDSHFTSDGVKCHKVLYS